MFGENFPLRSEGKLPVFRSICDLNHSLIADPFENGSVAFFKVFLRMDNSHVAHGVIEGLGSGEDVVDLNFV